MQKRKAKAYLESIMLLWNLDQESLLTLCSNLILTTTLFTISGALSLETFRTCQ